jgi:hypothetical protein
MIKIGWVFYSDEHRKDIETIISLSKEKGTLDELGLGSIRDAFANKFFPGTTTIQTRAKYFLIIPWILNDIYKNNIDFNAFRMFLKNEEVKVINALKKTEDQDGLIGKEAGEYLLRFPSSVYWSGLKKFNIILPDIALSQMSSFFTRQKSRESFSRKRLTKEDKLLSDFSETKDFKHLICDGLPMFPGLKEINFQLSHKEAHFLKIKILESQPKSLFAYILRGNHFGVCNLENFQELVDYIGNSNEFSEYLKSALLFDSVMKGCYIRYNLKVCEIGGVDNLEAWKDRWTFYLASLSKLNLSPGMFNKHFAEFGIRRFPAEFCQDWISAVTTKSINLLTIDNLIKRRELALKNINRSRLSNNSIAKKAELPISISVEPSRPEVHYLNYRFNVARKLLSDLFIGLNHTGDE